MFSEFLGFFKKDIQYDIYGSEYRTFIIAFGGMQFGKGVFTVFTRGDLSYWNDLVAEIFPKHKRGIYLFGHDWRGRCYAVKEPGTEAEKILVFDPGELEIKEVSVTFMDFVNKEIPGNPDEHLELERFIEWYNTSEIKINDIQCVGYDIPPFKGGVETLDNTEVADIDLYWKRMADEAKEFLDFDNELSESEQDFYAEQADDAERFFVQQKKRETYIGKNVDTYLEKFKKMHNKDTNVSWNWCAFLFCEFWFAYRKMYGVAALVWGIPYALGTVLGIVLGFSNIDMASITMIANAAGVIIGLIFMVFVGMFGDHFYRKKVDKLVEMGESAESQEELQGVIKRGGTSGAAMGIAMLISVAASILLEFI